MIGLGAFDADVGAAARDEYVKELETLTRVPLVQVAAGRDRIAFATHAPSAQEPLTVAEVQRTFKALGFFPGGKVDGICGYRTLSAIRLFQEYVRSVEKLPCVPDGRFGPESQAHLKRWMSQKLTMMAWAPTIEQWRAGTLGDTMYTRWLTLLSQVKGHYLANPSRMLQKVNAYNRPTDTRKVADWDFSPKRIHLIGIRRSQANLKFDDVVVLLIKGLVFTFQGSTDPGAMAESATSYPFLVQGQHDYHFGWHRKKYLALRPLTLREGSGVLVLPSTDSTLDDADLAAELRPNYTINIHWGGPGGTSEIKTWSEGCQVINGRAYLAPNDELVDCSAFAALGTRQLETDMSKTRGAYNLLLDLVVALGSDLESQTVKYMLLTESDLALGPEIARSLAAAREKARAHLPA